MNRNRISPRTLPADSVANGAALRPTPGPPLAELNFDNAYRRFRMNARELRDTDRRLEFWDGDTETAVEVREGGATTYHEGPSQRLAQLVERIAIVRGSPIACFGNMDLVFPAELGHRARLMVPDQSLYLHPERAKPLGHSRMMVGRNHYPDVVMEVDYSTDVRRNKLRLYEAWGFPEVWVDVPRQSQRRRPHGIAIYVREGSALAPAQASRAFPGWQAAEIEAALNEAQLSEGTVQVLERIGRILGEPDGTGPDDDPQIRSLLQQAQVNAQTQATAAELERRAAFVRRLLESRGVAVGPRFPLDQPAFADADVEAVADIALHCTSQADFAARLREAGNDAETRG